MKNYIVQIKYVDNFVDVWKTEKLWNARRYARYCRSEGYKVRIVKEI